MEDGSTLEIRVPGKDEPIYFCGADKYKSSRDSEERNTKRMLTLFIIVTVLESHLTTANAKSWRAR
jgi:hypothetical protein